MLDFAWRLMGPLGGFPALLSGAVAGAIGLFAVLRRDERAVAVYLAIVPLGLVILFVLAELLVGHH